jgi:putative hydrolase of the HAD superfamily
LKRYRAVLFDAGNTLIFLDYARLADEVGAAVGIPLTGEGLARHNAGAVQAMERAGSDKERATAYLEALFLLSGVPRESLERARECLARMHSERNLWSVVPERSAESLARLREAGLKLGVVSNSDGRVEQALEDAGLRHYFDVVIDSTLIGVEKPDPRIFHAALQALEVAPDEALYIGDLYEVDVLGARAAGLDAVLLGTPDRMNVNCRTASSIPDLVNELLSGKS